MPKYQFLKNNEILNKNNLKQKIKELLDITTKKPINIDNKIKQKLEEAEIKSLDDKLAQFIFTAKRKINNDDAIILANKNGLNNDVIRKNHIEYFKTVLSKKYITKDARYNQKMALLNDVNRTNKMTYKEIIDEISPLIQPNFRSYLTPNIADSLTSAFLKRNIDDFLDLVIKNLTDEEIKTFGEEINKDNSFFEYISNDKINKTTYDKDIELSLDALKKIRKLGDKNLDDNDIKEYINSLNYANILLGKSGVDFNKIKTIKNDIDTLMEEELNKDISNRLNNMNYDLNPLILDQSNNMNPYYKIDEGKNDIYFNTRNNIEFNVSNNTKNNIKEILYKMKEFGFDKLGSSNQKENNLYGLKILADPITKFKRNITGLRIEDNDVVVNQNVDDATRKKLRTAVFSKEIMEADLKVHEIINMIKSNIKINDVDNFSYLYGIDSLNNEQIPIKYRIDYPSVSVLNTLSLMLNIINENGWNIDEFLNSPMEHIRKLYDDKYYNVLDPLKNYENKSGSEILFDLGRNVLDKEFEEIDKNASILLEGLALLDDDKNNRLNNYAKYKTFNNTIKAPYQTMKNFKCNIVSNNNLDKLIIKPNLNIEDLGINRYDAKEIKIIEAKEDNFDDINYLKLRKEKIEDFKDRIDNEILSYLNEEAKLIKESKIKNISSLDTNKYLDIVQKAVAKYLIINADKAESEEYVQLNRFLRHKDQYVNELISKIPTNYDYNKYITVIELRSNPVKLLDGSEYQMGHFNTVNQYHSITTSFIQYKNEHYIVDERNNINFLNTDKNKMVEIKNIYNSYIQANQSYINEVKKIYGENYHGKIDNFNNDKIKLAFIKRNELLRQYNELKNDNLNNLKELYKDGKIPLTYLKDREISFNNNTFVELPFFRSQHQFTLDEFIKFKYPNEEIEDDVKELLFNNYKADVEREEIDYFSRKYLRFNNLVGDKEIKEELPIETKQNINIDEKLEDINFIVTNIDEIDINNFDSIDYILEDDRSIKEFKDYIDKRLTNYIKDYYNANINDKKSLKDMPALKDIINVAQNVAFRYLILKGDNNSNEYNELSNFIIDGNNYIDKLIAKENSNIAKNNHELLNLKLEESKNRIVGNDEFKPNPLIKYSAKDFNIKDSDINKNSLKFIEFNKYLENNIKNYKFPQNIKTQEEEINNKLKPLFDKYNELKEKYNDYELDNINLGNNYSEEEKNLNNLGNIFNNKKDIDFDNEFNNLYENLYNELAKAKEIINNYYKNGEVSEDYVKERFERLDNGNLKIPSMFEIDYKLSMNDYFKINFKDNYKDLNKNEKTSIYNQYTKKCIEQRRKHYAIKYLEENNPSLRFNRDSATYKKYIEDNELNIEENKEDINNIFNIDINNNDDFINKIAKDVEEDNIPNYDDDIILINNEEINKIIK